MYVQINIITITITIGPSLWSISCSHRLFHGPLYRFHGHYSWFNRFLGRCDEPIDDSTDLFANLMDPSPNFTHLCQVYRPLCLFHGPIDRIIIKRPCVDLAESFHVVLGWFHGPLANFINPTSISWTNRLISQTRPLASSPGQFNNNNNIYLFRCIQIDQNITTLSIKYSYGPECKKRPPEWGRNEKSKSTPARWSNDYKGG